MDLKEIKKSLKKRNEFFVSFEEEFYSYFEDALSRFSFSKDIKERISKIKSRLYNRIFISPKENREDVYNYAYTLAKENIEIRELLKEVFVYTVKSFSDYLIKTKPSIKDLHFLTTLLNEYYSLFEQAYIDYEKIREEQTERPETGREKYEEEFILQLLGKHAGKDITAVSYYKEVPIVFKTKIKKTTDKFIVLDISKTSINVSKLNKPVYLKGDFLEKPVKGKILSVDFSRNIFVLEHPRFSDIPAEKRKDIRVELSEPIKAIIRGKDRETMGLIIDISAGGLRFYTGDLKDLKKNDEIEAVFEISGNKIKTKGIIKNIKQAGKGFLVGVQIKPDYKSETLISDFVMTRQFEILKELRI